MEVEFPLPPNAFTLVEEKLREHGRRFGRSPAELLTAILTGRIKPIRQEDEIVVMDVPDYIYDRVVEALRAWPETHGEDFGTFVVMLALGRYDLVEVPPERPRRTNGHRKPPIPRCRVCGRPLKSPEAIAKGIGPVCEAKLQTQAA